MLYSAKKTVSKRGVVLGYQQPTELVKQNGKTLQLLTGSKPESTIRTGTSLLA